MEDRLRVSAVLDLPAAVDVVVGAGLTEYHTCALLHDATVQCWDSNIFNQLGDGTTTSRPSPVAVAGLDQVSALDATEFANCAVRLGEVWCWGLDYATIPTRVEGLNGVTRVSSGLGHACAVLSSGRVFCWGSNSFGQLGNGSTGDSPTPVEVLGLSGGQDVAAERNNSCAVLDTGAVRCWGADYGLSPTVIAGVADAVRVEVAGGHACALLGGGSVACWGDNSSGQLGDGTTEPRTTAVAVLGLTGATEIGIGDARSCAVARGAAYCWGGGPLGDGVNAPSTRPVAVLAPR